MKITPIAQIIFQNPLDKHKNMRYNKRKKKGEPKNDVVCNQSDKQERRECFQLRI